MNIQAKRDRIEELILLLTDPENQPHQYVDSPGLLRNALFEIMPAEYRHRLEQEDNAMDWEVYVK